jgi:hypothetical protein
MPDNELVKGKMGAGIKRGHSAFLIGEKQNVPFLHD